MQMNTAFFTEILKSLQTRRRHAATSQVTLRCRRLITCYLEGFRVVYRFQLIQVRGNQSNWEAYIGTQMCTAYINNAELHCGKHLRAIINVIFDVKG